MTEYRYEEWDVPTLIITRTKSVADRIEMIAFDGSVTYHPVTRLVTEVERITDPYQLEKWLRILRSPKFNGDL